jgi:hypothetical protein
MQSVNEHGRDSVTPQRLPSHIRQLTCAAAAAVLRLSAPGQDLSADPEHCTPEDTTHSSFIGQRQLQHPRPRQHTAACSAMNLNKIQATAHT